MDGRLDQGIEEFNRGEYFEAHDTWEEVWRETRGEERLFYQGLIQAAVGLYHLSCGNITGATSQLLKAIAKLEQYPSSYCNVRTDELLCDLRDRLSTVDLPAGPPRIRRV
jgi:predicted metal-dependent hydrolase